MRSDTKKKILNYLKKYKQAKPGILAKKLHLSRVAIHRQLKELVFQGKIKKIGMTPHIVYVLFEKPLRKNNPHYLWDYDYDELKKTEEGRIKILERMINYGPGKGEKIPLDQVKKYWDRLDLYPNSRRLMELLIWGKYLTSRPNKQIFSIK